MSSALPTDAIPIFSRFLKDSLGDMLRFDAQTFEEMLAEDAVMEFPYAPRDGVRRVEGRANIAEYVAGVASIIQIDEIVLDASYHTVTAGVVVLEFRGFGTGTQTGEPYEQSYISVVTTRDGTITHYRDYWNPLVAMETTGGTDAIITAVGGKEN